MSKWMEAMVKKHGSEEAVREFMRKNGSKGGKAQVKKGFAMNPELAKKMGKLTRKK